MSSHKTESIPIKENTVRDIMELIYAKNFNCILLWISLLVIIISTTTALTADHEADDNSLNTNLNEDEEPEFDNSNAQQFYSLRLNPKYYGTLQHLLNKRIKGSEFLGKRMGSEFLGKRADGFYKVKKMGSEFLGRRRRSVPTV
ncbi:unnamed protein product [Oppiella nova]|uniref:Uncharacterized protein n=1 Tax=Oppiella nova TaxID=334625 RepID=A0A7R9MNB4_9ACAR|nr:unnamed protein product [Oppiella nova]CAG2179678.1 unnamed protein product [Oppiella nova]